jgi:hypothetical protein
MFCRCLLSLHSTPVQGSGHEQLHCPSAVTNFVPLFLHTMVDASHGASVVGAGVGGGVVGRAGVDGGGGAGVDGVVGGAGVDGVGGAGVDGGGGAGVDGGGGAGDESVSQELLTVSMAVTETNVVNIHEVRLFSPLLTATELEFKCSELLIHYLFKSNKLLQSHYVMR